MKKYFINSSFFLLIITLLSAGCTPKQPGQSSSWTIGPFVKVDSVNPVMGPIDSVAFTCPVREKTVNWEAKDVFNPAAVVKDGKVFLLYRAEDSIGKLAGTSRIGLAESKDGLYFNRFPRPVLYPDSDQYLNYEWEGGCEDPRVVQNNKGNYFMTYTAWNGDKTRLFVASSTDLVHWTKHGSAFEKAYNGKYFNVFTKSGAIVCKRVGNKFVATKINGKYWMYFGDTNIYIAYSDDLINWTPVEKNKKEISANVDNTYGKASLFAALQPRKGKFDSQLVEPGPFAMMTDKGILLIYNSKNSKEYGDTTLPVGTYAAGQALFDLHNPKKLIARTSSYFMKPDKTYEITGQVNNVCFVEGLAYYHEKWFLYYGTADSKIAVAVYNPEKVVSN